MKILLVHNFYGSTAPSGENTVFTTEKEMLRGKGHEIIEYTTSSDKIRSIGVAGSIIGAIGVPWNPFHGAKIRKLIRAEQPDVMHVHNTFPILSPAIFYATYGTQVATVLTLHNYRIFCAAGIPMRGNKPCTDCLDTKSVWSALRFGCYRDSRIATFPMAVMIALHHTLGTWQKHVDAFIALTRFQREKMISAGLPADKLYIKPHFYSDPPTPLPWSERSDKIIYIGRLGEEKGVKYLIDAWKNWGSGSPELDVVGDGPLKDVLKNMAAKGGLGSKVNFLGQLPFYEVQKRLAESKLLVLPSVCFEGFPMVIREAFSLGVPAAVSNLGSMPCIVNDGHDGVLFNPGDSYDLSAVVQSVWYDQEKLAAMGGKGRIEFEKKYTEAANHETLMKIYHTAMLCKKKRVSSSSDAV